MSLSNIWQTLVAARSTAFNAFKSGDLVSSVSPVYETKMVGMLNVLPYKNIGDVGSQAVYPRASNVLLIPPLGNEEASGSCCTNSLPLNFSIPESASKNESCFSAV